jgi:hypothetical protein
MERHIKRRRVLGGLGLGGLGFLVGDLGPDGGMSRSASGRGGIVHGGASLPSR